MPRNTKNISVLTRRDTGSSICFIFSASDGLIMHPNPYIIPSTALYEYDENTFDITFPNGELIKDKKIRMEDYKMKFKNLIYTVPENRKQKAPILPNKIFRYKRERRAYAKMRIMICAKMMRTNIESGYTVAYTTEAPSPLSWLFT